ncbi:MAG TPA: redoxin domain-containing protein [Polyangiaceae bacterium]|nr:redoxin domain-containing protein [Polyangiaceae bacterium]
MRFGLRLASTTAFVIALSAAVALTGHVAEGQSRLRPWLGVELDKAGTVPRGVRIHHAVRSSPAWSAGVRDGDVIVRVEDAVASRPDDVIREVAAHTPGALVRVVLLRSGAEVLLTITLQAAPDGDEMLRLDKVGAPAPASWKGLASVAGPLPGGIAELRGRVVIVDFWATWCMACRMSAPKLTSWQAKFGAQGLSVIGITDDPVEQASAGAQDFGMRYATVASDESYATQRAFGVRALPTVFVIDKRGVIRDVSVGFDPRKEAQMESLLRRLLAEPAP